MKLDRDKILWGAAIHLFLRPLLLCWCWEYFQEDFDLPIFSYWKCFWLLFAVSTFRPWYVMTKDWNAEYATKEKA